MDILNKKALVCSVTALKAEDFSRRLPM